MGRKQRSTAARKGLHPRSKKGFKGTPKHHVNNVNTSLNIVNNPNDPNAVNNESNVNNPSDSVVVNNVNIVNNVDTHQDKPPSSAPQSADALRPVPSPKTNKKTPKKSTLVKYRELRNASAEKLKNSGFNKLKKYARTRSQSTTINKRYKIAKDNKIIDVSLLSEAIAKCAVCKHCKLSKSVLHLKEVPKLKKGLCETLAFQCNKCRKTTTFKTRRERRKKRAEKKSKPKSKKTYLSGSFSLSENPDTDKPGASKKRSAPKRKAGTDISTAAAKRQCKVSHLELEVFQSEDNISLVFVCDSTVTLI